uniref:Molybdopterin biosynthesis protein n=1 Tax=Laurencieae sp. TaxID=2007162 RepID=A0A1Z1M3A1_9FLOR|nr:Molybdopterin biosynthesis protein [Laurencieae sp.]
MLNPKINLVKLSNNEYLRYSKQIVLENIGIEGQKRIKKAKILIIGAGGLSCPIMTYLAALGTGYIGIMDSDKVEISNLNRQVLYNEININTLKVISAKSQLYQINKNCKTITHKYKLDNKNSKEIIPYYDIVIDTSDNFETRHIINETCCRFSKTYIYGAVDNFIGQIGVFNYKDGIKYNYLYSQNVNAKNQNCNFYGIMGVTTGYIGILQAIETIKIITGHKQRLNNSIIICNMIDIQIKVRKIYKPQNYNNTVSTNQSKNITKQVVTTKKFNKFNKNSPIFIDIRNSKEFINEHINKSINIPLLNFKIHKTLKFLKKYEQTNLIYIYCNTSNRSLIVSSILKLHQIKHYVLKQNSINEIT